MVESVGIGLGSFGFSSKPTMRWLRSDFQNAEMVRGLAWKLNCGNRHIGSHRDMEFQQLAVVHFVDVIAAEDQDVVGISPARSCRCSDKPRLPFPGTTSPTHGIAAECVKMNSPRS